MGRRLAWFLTVGVACSPAGADGDASSGSESDDGSSAESGAVAPNLKINEVACDGEDFVEIINVGDDAADLADVYVDDGSDGTHRAGFAAATLAPGAFALATLDDFGLRCGDEAAVLRFADADLDEVTAPAPTAQGNTWGRLPDGTGEWLETSATPGAMNVAAEAVADLFDLSRIHDIEVELDATSLAAIDAESVTPIICVPHERDYYAGTVTIDGERFDGVGVRARGNGTADSLYGKPSLKLDFAWDDPAVPGCAEDRVAFGQRKLNLLNMRQDPSFVRIPLAGELYRSLGVPQPRTSYARLTINGEYTGIVVLAENIDRRFVGEWFGSNDGMMYEAGCHCDVIGANVPADGGASCFTQDFAIDACDVPNPEQDPIDWESLRAFTTALDALPAGGFYPEIENVFDFDGFMTLWAATMFLGSGDGYFLNQNSFRIYHDPSTDRFAMIDHGSADGILRTFSDVCDANLVMQLGAAPDVFASTGVLATRCLAEPDCAAAYAARLWEIHDAFDGFGLRTRAEALHGFILDEMRDDPRYYYNGCGQNYAWADIEGHFADYVLPWIDRRFDEVSDQLTAAGHPR